jgi:hypothetical protein
MQQESAMNGFVSEPTCRSNIDHSTIRTIVCTTRYFTWSSCAPTLLKHVTAMTVNSHHLFPTPMFSTKYSCGKTANRHEDEAFDVAFSVVVLIAKETSESGSGASNYWHTFHNSQRFSSIKSLRCSDR